MNIYLIKGNTTYALYDCKDETTLLHSDHDLGTFVICFNDTLNFVNKNMYHYKRKIMLLNNIFIINIKQETDANSADALLNWNGYKGIFSHILVK